VRERAVFEFNSLSLIKYKLITSKQNINTQTNHNTPKNQKKPIKNQIKQKRRVNASLHYKTRLKSKYNEPSKKTKKGAEAPLLFLDLVL
jgi:hypothetical protein